MKYSREELLELKGQYTSILDNFDKIHDIFNKTSIESKYWKPNGVITNEYDKIKKHTFNILNKLTLDNFPKMSTLLSTLLHETTPEMVQIFIHQMIVKCVNEKTYNHLYVELYIFLKDEIEYFYEYFMDTLQELYFDTTKNNIFKRGLLMLIINLYKKHILNEVLIHHCLEEYFQHKNFEFICLIFEECGKYLNHEKAKEYNKKHYFDILENEMNNHQNGMKICFKIQEIIELYKNNWTRM